jgi:hypothetical protein
MKNSYKILVDKPEGKIPLGRCLSRWEDDIKMYVKEILCGGIGWTGLIWLYTI